MFARLYKSAKAIFTDSAEIETTKPNRDSKLLRDETMVTTRQKDMQAPADHGIEGEDSINVYVTSSISKRQRKGTKRTSSSEEDEAEYVPPSTRKRKRLPMRAKDVGSPDPGKTRPVVEIPAKKISPEPDHVNTFTNEEAGEGMGDKNAQGEEHDAATAEIPEKLNHRRFGSEPAEDEFFSTAREQVNEENAMSKPAIDSRVIQDSEDEDSDDDAPEAVGMQEAAKSVKIKEEEAARVVKDQLSASRKKRKERDEALKKQVESSKKRKLENDLTSIPKQAKRLAGEDDEPLSLETDLGMVGDDSRVVEEELEVQKPLRLSTKRALPDVLPAEYLEDEELREQLPFEQFPIKKAKKTKFHLIAEKEPKDRGVGPTTYRVTKANSTNLAPKSSFNARNTKEQWLLGRSGKKGATSRTPFSKGFFKK